MHLGKALVLEEQMTKGNKGVSATGSDLTPGKGWVVYLDVYGFAASVEDEKQMMAVTRRLVRALAKLDEGVVWAGRIPRRLAFSDSLFLFYPARRGQTRTDALQDCVADVEQVMRVYADESLPLRGGLAFGNVVYGQGLLVGAPVVRAHRYEGLMPAPLALVPKKEMIDPRHPTKFDWEVLTEKLSLKDGMVMDGMLVMPSPIEWFATLVDRKLGEHAISGPYDVALAWMKAREFIRNRISLWRRESDAISP